MKNFSILFKVYFVFTFFLIGCNPQTDREIKKKEKITDKPKEIIITEPSIRIYFSNLHNYQSSSSLIINFGKEVAPFSSSNFKGEKEISISPSVNGNWRWLDPSNLVFSPTDAFKPETKLSIDLTELKIRDNVNLNIKETNQRKIVEFTTPAFEANISKCVYEDIKEKPFSRKISAEVITNYPFSEATFRTNSSLFLVDKNNKEQKLNLITNKAFEAQNITVASERILRPSEDGNIELSIKPAAFGKSDDNKLSLSCRLLLSQKDFDIAAENNKLEATISAHFGTAQDNDKLILPIILDFSEKTSSTNYNIKIPNTNPADTIISEGIKMTPEIKGIWRNGTTDQSNPNYGNLYFTPEEPLPPGIKFDIELDPKLFPDLIFDTLKTFISVASFNGNFSTPVIYTEPNDLKIKKVTSTLTFNYPPQKGEIERLLQVFISEPKGDRLDYNQRAIGFEIKYDQKDPKIVYIISAPISISERTSLVKFALSDGINSIFKGQPTTTGSYAQLEIPSVDDYFNLKQISTLNVVKDDGSVDRILSIQGTTELENIEDLKSRVSAYLLPDCSEEESANKIKSCKAHRNPQFFSADEVFDDVIQDSTVIPLTYVSSNEPENITHNFKFSAPDKRKVFIKILAGIKSKDDYVIKKDTRAVAEISTETRALKIQHAGSLLSLSGDKKLGIVARGVTTMEAELARILPRNLNHLLTVTDGDISKPEFNYYRFSSSNISEKFRFTEEFPQMEGGKPFYSVVDFGRFIKNGEQLPKGLFILTIKEKAKDGQDEEESTTSDDEYSEEEEYEEGEEGSDYNSYQREEYNDIKDSRLVLLTDIGIIVKDSDNGEHNLYTFSFRSGEPLEGAKVSLIGKNGLPIMEGSSDSSGKVLFSKTDDFKDEKEPISYVVEKDGDLSFLPFRKSDRQLNFSKFDTGGVYNSEEVDSLQAYLFSDRGIYRPGETAHISTILRKRDWSGIPNGIPLEIAVKDPRGQNTANFKVAFDKFGFEEISFDTDTNAPTGLYTFTLNIIKNKNDKRSLGSTTIKVENFQPDRLNVKSSIGTGTPGFAAPKELKAKVDVLNLFGTPAIGNKVKATLWVSPWSGYLEQFRDYSFRKTDPETLPNTSQDLGEMNTDESGSVEFLLGLDKFSEPVYQISFTGEGYEKGSGRSVINSTSKLISSFQALVGVKSGSLDYITKDSDRSVKLTAINQDLKSVKLENLTVLLQERTYIATLVKQPNGLLAYESTLKKNLLKTENLALNPGDNELKLDTSKPGNFEIEIRDSEDQLLNSFSYTIAGDGNISRNIEHNALLDIKLNKREYDSGEEIEAQIVSPFTGAGLITIETDKVVAHKWFKAANNATVQKIKVPANLIGNAYFSVTYARSLDSKEIYLNPLSYGSVPFNISKAKFKNQLSVSSPGEITDNKKLEINYQVSSASRLAIFAVDEGILQFARYNTPDPLSGFFKKRALQVKTFQILDLLLPDYSIAKEVSSSGGDEDSGAGKFKNPFSRKNKPPVVFWGGIKTVKEGKGRIEMDLPEYFNGSVKVFAVAVNDKKIGVASSTTKVKRPFVILPQMPYAVSPNDEFEIGALIANNIVGSGNNTKVKVEFKTNDSFTTIEKISDEFNIPEGRELPVRFKLKANQKLLSSPVSIKVSSKIGEKTVSAESDEEISIRPSQPFMTKLTAGVIRPGTQDEFRDIPLTRAMFPEKSETTASISPSPASLIKGMIEYLKSYPYGCNEQTISNAFPALVLGNIEEFGLNKKDADKFIYTALKKLKIRQKYDGSFGYWDIVSPTDNFITTYAAHFMLEARNRGYSVDEDVISRAKNYLDTLTSEKKTGLLDLLAQSYGTFVLTSFGDVTTDKARAIEENLTSEWGDKWQKTAIRLFLAGSYKMLKLDEDAKRLLGELPKVWECGSSRCSFPFPVNHHGFFIGAYYSIATNLFPEIFTEANKQTANLLKMGEELASRDNYTLTYSFGLLGMSGLLKNFAASDSSRFPIWIDGNQVSNTNPTGSAVNTVQIPFNSKMIRFKNDNSFPIFYTVKESGFDNSNVTDPVSSKIVVERKLVNENGDEVNKIKLQDKLYLNLSIKPQGDLNNIAIVDIIPGGFEIDLTEEGLGSRKSMLLEELKPGSEINNDPWQPDYIDVQEDRVIFFGSFTGSTKTFTYRLKPLNIGKFNVPPTFAEGMYDNEVYYRGVNKQIEVER